MHLRKEQNSLINYIIIGKHSTLILIIIHSRNCKQKLPIWH